MCIVIVRLDEAGKGESSESSGDKEGNSTTIVRPDTGESTGSSGDEAVGP